MPIGLGAAIGLGTAAVTAGTAIAGAVSGGDTISSGQQAANTAQTQAYQDYSNNEQPYISTGTNALNSLADADGLNGATGDANALAQFTASPGYQYDLSQGLSAIDNGAASTGTLRSGNTIRAEQTLGNNLADQDFSAYLGRLNSLAGTGQTATAALGSAGVTTGAGVASTDTSAATAQTNLTNNALKGVGTAATGALNNPTVQNALTGSTASAAPVSGGLY